MVRKIQELVTIVKKHSLLLTALFAYVFLHLPSLRLRHPYALRMEPVISFIAANVKPIWIFRFFADAYGSPLIHGWYDFFSVNIKLCSLKEHVLVLLFLLRVCVYIQDFYMPAYAVSLNLLLMITGK